jgi:hypothetical protein
VTTPPLALAAALAWALVRRVPSPRQWAIAATLAGLLAVNIFRPLLRPWEPLYVAAFLAWYAATAWCVWRVLRKDEGPRRSVELPFLGPRLLDHPDSNRSSTRHESGSTWHTLLQRAPFASHCEHVGRAQGVCLAIALLASSALAVRVGLTLELSRLVFALALAAQVLAALRFVSRGRWPDDAQRVALILVASSVVDATPGPWLLGMPARDWAVGRWIAVATWLVIAGWEIRCLIRAHRSRA